MAIIAIQIARPFDDDFEAGDQFNQPRRLGAPVLAMLVSRKEITRKDGKPMDLAYWGFSHWPFQRQHLAKTCSVGESQDEALARLLFLVEECRHCGLLTGASGTGKTCLLRLIASRARRTGRLCLEIDATGIDASEFAAQIAEQDSVNFDDSLTSAKCWSGIQQQLASHAVVNQPIVALIDNMDSAQPGSSQAIRRLMNLAEATGAKLTVLMTTQLPFPTSELRNDIDLSVELSGWSVDETARFIRHSINSAGVRSNLFSSDAVSALHELTRGIPRDVIRVCDLSLLAAMSHDRREVDAAIVIAATDELSDRRPSTESNWQAQPLMRSL